MIVFALSLSALLSGFVFYFYFDIFSSSGVSAKHVIFSVFFQQPSTVSRNCAEAFIVWFSTKYCSYTLFMLKHLQCITRTFTDKRSTEIYFAYTTSTLSLP
jgi:hypothetical protein